MEQDNDIGPSLTEGNQDRERAANLAAGLALEHSASDAPPDTAAMTHTRSGSGQQGPGVIPAIMRFGMELPGRSIAGGIRDAGQGLLQSAWDVSKWIAENESAMDKAMKEGRDTVEPKDMPTGKELPQTGPELPDIAKPTTTPGEMVRDVAHFMTGYAVTNAVLPGMGLAQTPRALLAGAITQAVDFDPGQQRLSNLIQKYPLLQNPITEYLQTSPNDSRGLGRLKAAVEGLGLGVAAEGLLSGVRLVKAGMDKAYAGGASKIEGQVLPPAEGMPVKVEDFAPAGGTKGPITTVVDANEWKAKIAKAGAETADIPPGKLLETGDGRGVFVNLNKFNTSDDVKNTIQQVADLQSLSVKAAQRGVQSHEATQALANDLGVGVEEILKRNAGQPYNAEYSVAARKVWAASGEQVTDLAQRASSPAASAVDQFNFRRALAVHAAIQNEVIGARTETARALNAWKIPVGSGEEQAKGIMAMLEQSGGAQSTQTLAGAITRASQAGTLTPQGIGLLAQKGWGATTRDAMLHLYNMALLSGPQTQAVNFMGNAFVAATQAPERYLAGKLSKVLPGPGVAQDEASQFLFGQIEGLKDVWRWTSKNVRMMMGKGEGGSLPIPQRLTGSSKFDLQPDAISAQAFRMNPESAMGSAVDAVGAATSLPGNAMGAMDNAYKSVGYRGELYALAARQAAQESATAAAENPAAWAKGRIAELVANPPDAMVTEAVDSALRQTFQGEAGPFVKGVMGAIRGSEKFTAGVPLGRMIVPFVKVPAQIMDYSFEYTPLAPVISHVREDIAAGGARRALALTRIGVGTTVMATAMDMTLSGNITGGGHPNKSTEMARERENIPAYSIKMGDHWVQYNRADPLGSILGMSADLAEFLSWEREQDTDEMASRKLLAAGFTAVAANMTNKNYLTGFANTVDAIHDPAQYGPKFLKQFAGSFVPSVVSSVEKAGDPTIRATYDMLDAVKARTPGWSKDLPPSRDLWGNERTTASGLGWGFDMFAPLPVKKELKTPIDDEIRRLGVNVSMPSSRVSINGIPLDLTNWPKLYDKYIVQAGNGFKNDEGLGARDYLNRLVSGKADESETYKTASDGPDGGKATMIQAVIAKYRGAARNQLLQDSPDLQKEIMRKAVKKGADPGDFSQ